jgi:hypothetical protein
LQLLFQLKNPLLLLLLALASLGLVHLIASRREATEPGNRATQGPFSLSPSTVTVGPGGPAGVLGRRGLATLTAADALELPLSLSLLSLLAYLLLQDLSQLLLRSQLRSDIVRSRDELQ